ncbi:MAG: hypothetical protein ACI8QT_001705 [Halioglobus sp.]|jgi:hypothetical protein
MATHAMLNNIEHKKSRVDTRHGAEFGDAIMCTLAVPAEFRSVQADYPIFFHRHGDTDKYQPMAMFGFQRGENLFLSGNEWNATYIPLMIQRGPFAIGFQQSEEDRTASKKMVISIDMDSPRVGTNEGELLFDPFGGNSDYTDGVVEILQHIEQGQGVIDEFVEALLAHDLLEPFSLDVKLNAGSQHSLKGFYTIDEEKLAGLDGAVLADFSRRGILQACYMVIASMANIARLIELKNKRA